MLSEKAKGKQRAIDPPVDNQAGPSGSPAPVEEPVTRELVIRFTEGAPDLTVSVGKEDTVRNIKRTVRLPTDSLQGRQVLIQVQLHRFEISGQS